MAWHEGLGVLPERLYGRVASSEDAGAEVGVEGATQLVHAVVIDPLREARLADLALRALALVLPLDAAGEPAQTIGEGIGRVRGGQGRDLLVGAIELGPQRGIDAPPGGGHCREVIVGDRAGSDGRGEQRHPAQQFRMADNLSSRPA